MKDQRLYLLHVAECIDRIGRYMAEGTGSLVSGTMVYDAVLRNLQTMREATQCLDEQTKARHPAIPWQRISGFRNILVHGYLGDIEPSLVQAVVDNELSTLKAAILSELSDDPKPA